MSLEVAYCGENLDAFLAVLNVDRSIEGYLSKSKMLENRLFDGFSVGYTK